MIVLILVRKKGTRAKKNFSCLSLTEEEYNVYRSATIGLFSSHNNGSNEFRFSHKRCQAAAVKANN
jgi:hypothetical protein